MTEPDKIPLVRNKVVSYDFNISRPIFIKNILDKVGDELHNNIKQIIINTGDEWKSQATIVQANITNLNMHDRHAEFKKLCDIIIPYAEKMGSTPIKCRTSDCWGVMYTRGQYSVAHAHWPNVWSWCYYIDTPKGSSPLVFPDGKDGNHYIFPNSGDVVLFPAWFRHEVPPYECDEKRILVAGNLERIPYRELPKPSVLALLAGSCEN